MSSGAASNDFFVPSTVSRSVQSSAQGREGGAGFRLVKEASDLEIRFSWEVVPDGGWGPTPIRRPAPNPPVRPGGFAAILKAMLLTFFPLEADRFNFDRSGMFLRNGGQSFHLRCKFAAWLSAN